VFAFLLVAGCASQPAPPPPAPDVYTIRGVVVELPVSGDDSSGFYVRHEAIDDFRGVDGKVWGMDAMTMRFTPSEELSLDEIDVGDKVEMVFEVDWHGDPPQRVTRVTELPPETQLVFREANPAD